MTNEEILLRALNGESLAEGATFQPQNNTQAYLAYLVGLITDLTALPAPRTNEEALLYKACIDGIGGKLPELTNPATSDHILEGYEAIDSDGNKVDGRMPDHTQSPTMVRVSNIETGTLAVPYGCYSNENIVIDVEKKTVTPSSEEQEVTPSDGAVLGKVIVLAAEVGDVPVITDASYLFCNGARTDHMKEFLALCSGVVDTSYMFQNCRGLKSIDVSGLNTSNVTKMSNMFNHCENITSLDVSAFDTSKVIDMGSMFSYCNKLRSLDVSNFVTNNVTNMSGMFSGCNYLPVIDLSKFDTSKVTAMGSMFYACNAVTKLDLSNFDTGAVTSMSGIFSNCTALKEIIGFSAMNKAGISIAFPSGSSSSSRFSLKRLTFRTDLPAEKYAIRSAINIKYCSFERSGMVEMFNTLTDVSSLGLSSNYRTITITGNPCVTGTLPNGTACETLTNEDKAIATSKGWTLVT